MEILNDCTDVDEIKFQEDGTWCPMRPKKEALKVSSPHIPKVESKAYYVTMYITMYSKNIHTLLNHQFHVKSVSLTLVVRLVGSAPVRQCAVVPHAEVSSSKKADVIDLTLDSSSEDEQEVEPPHKRRCVYMAKPEDMHGKG